MSRLKNNIVYNIFGQGLLLILGFVAVKFIFKRLGEDALGIIYFSATINGIFCTMLEMGICSTTVREVSAYYESEPKYIKDLIRTFSLFYWVFFAIAGAAIFFLAPLLVEKWIILKTMDSVTAIYILRILGIASFIALPKSFYASLFNGLQRMEFNNFIDVITAGLQQFGSIFILSMGGNVFQVVYWYAACYVIGVIAYLVVAANLFPVKVLIPGYSSGIVKRNIHFASRMLFVSMTSAIHAQVDKVCISKLLPVGILGYYGFTYGVVSRGASLTSAISQAVFPSFSTIYKSGDHAGLMLQYQKLQDLLCFASVPILAVVPFALLPVFSLVFNEEIARTLLLPATFLCLGFYMNATAAIPFIFSLAVGRPDIAARQHLYNFFVTVPVTILLVYYMGVIGASFSMVFFYTFVYFYTIRRICSECMAIPAWNWYFRVSKVYALISVTYGIAWIILVLSDAFSVAHLFIAYLSASTAFLIIAYFMIGDELRETILLHLSACISKLPKRWINNTKKKIISSS